MMICSSALIGTALLAYQIFLPDSPKREREHSVGIGLYVRGINGVDMQPKLLGRGRQSRALTWHRADECAEE